MKKWLIFGGGVLTGIVLTIVFAFVLSKHNTNNNGITWFDKPGEVINGDAFKVIQVIGKDAALVMGKSDNTFNLGIDMYMGAVYLITNDEGKYYYDDEIIKVTDGKIVRQVGVYKYKTNSNSVKTVPIIVIMDN